MQVRERQLWLRNSLTIGGAVGFMLGGIVWFGFNAIGVHDIGWEFLIKAISTILAAGISTWLISRWLIARIIDTCSIEKSLCASSDINRNLV